MNKRKEGDRALVNGEPCVRVSIKSGMRECEKVTGHQKELVNDLCSWCPKLPEYNPETPTCHYDCGDGFVWLNEVAYVELQLIQ